jgi:hypothetical protein
MKHLRYWSLIALAVLVVLLPSFAISACFRRDITRGTWRWRIAFC